MRCIVRRPTPELLPGETEVIGDIAEDIDWSRVLRGVDVVVHLAGRVHILRETSGDPEAAFSRCNSEATLCLARSAVREGVRRLIFLSTVGVHGMVAERPLVETDPIRPWNAYARSKWEAEQGLEGVARDYGLELVIIRAPLIYGEGVKGNFLRLLTYVDCELPLPLANAANRRSLVALETVTDLITGCIGQPHAAAQTFLVADEHALSTSELVHEIASRLRRRPRLFPVPRAAVQKTLKLMGKEALANRLYGPLKVDATKVQRELGWSPPISVYEGLDKVARWYVRRLR